MFVTIQGQRLDTKFVKQHLNARKVRIATADELAEHFGAVPGSAYPFGFTTDIPIILDSRIIGEGSLLYSTPLTTATLEISGSELRRPLFALPNWVLDLA